MKSSMAVIPPSNPDEPGRGTPVPRHDPDSVEFSLSESGDDAPPRPPTKRKSSIATLQPKPPVPATDHSPAAPKIRSDAKEKRSRQRSGTEAKPVPDWPLGRGDDAAYAKKRAGRRQKGSRGTGDGEPEEPAKWTQGGADEVHNAGKWLSGKSESPQRTDGEAEEPAERTQGGADEVHNAGKWLSGKSESPQRTDGEAEEPAERPPGGGGAAGVVKKRPGRKRKAPEDGEESATPRKAAGSQQPRRWPSSSREFEQKYDFASDGDDVPVAELVEVPEEKPAGDDEDLPIAMRRTKRVKVKPLRFWIGEKIVYGYGDNGTRGFAHIQTPDSTRKKG
jgi:hypothetical protein